jgi:hypothetical protein
MSRSTGPHFRWRMAPKPRFPPARKTACKTRGVPGGPHKDPYSDNAAMLHDDREGVPGSTAVVGRAPIGSE